MIPAFITTLCFAFSVIFAARSTRLLGGSVANVGRLIFALLFLGTWAHLFGEGLAGKSFPLFLVSGCIGFGFGDIALFLALPRLGPRLTILLAQCLAAPFGVLLEWLWLGTTLRSGQLVSGAVILAGVAVAMAPRRQIDVHRSGFATGALCGVVAALGQAAGAVISRKASFVAVATGLPIDGVTAAYQRMIGGILVAVAFALFTPQFRQNLARIRAEGLTARATAWVMMHALAGPTIGVSCYQWALATTPTGIVLPIVATAPIFTIPLAWLVEGDTPTARSIIGGVIAVAGTVALTRT